MILFLTSSPCDDNVPQGVQLPCIFFERNAFVKNLCRAVPKEARGLLIAAYPDAHAHNDEMASTFGGCFAYHDRAFSRWTLLDSRNAADAAELVKNSDVIVLAGGHVPTENAFFKELGLRELLTGYHGVVMGVSAGSMNMADTVYAQPEEKGEAVDPAYRRFIPGLGLTELNVLPHYQMVKDNILDGLRLFEDITFGDSFGRTFYVLEDSSYILEENGRATVYGRAWTIRDGVMTPLCEDGGSVQL